MLKHIRTRTLAAALGGTGWAHPYSDPFTCYADGGAGGDGGTGDGDDGGQDGGTDEADDQDAEDSDDDGDRDGADEDALGDKGKKALRELRRENRQLKARLRDQGGDASRKAAKGAKSEDDGADNDPEAIRERAREEARAEVWTERVEAAAVAEAAGRLANPRLAARLIDLSDIPKNDKGRPDREAISELIDELLEDEPYLAAPATGGTGRRFQGDADSGARKKTKKAAASLDEAVAAKFAGKSGG
ncbi:hypothetical protein AB0P02_21450 [Streptomyces griseoluteus]|uniref:hypothetical protein n=1 Tax=Streptomyces griseoluteus TaxID=29306 RepID=UPI00342F9008